jgi:hypothetical protein
MNFMSRKPLKDKCGKMDGQTTLLCPVFKDGCTKIMSNKSPNNDFV